ncbi:hypothetical protein ROZALSC1DRAFT_15671, partial [Rozella allomycis CSF55]
NLMMYMFLLRVAPVVPNWSVNILAPHSNVPLRMFFVSTMIGVSVPSWIYVQMGENLNSIKSLDGIDWFSWSNVKLFLAMFLVLMIPRMLTNKSHKRRQHK